MLHALQAETAFAKMPELQIHKMAWDISAIAHQLPSIFDGDILSNLGHKSCLLYIAWMKRTIYHAWTDLAKLVTVSMEVSE